MGSPIVSVSCTTFNQAPYIKDCLDGFLIQKTNFDFEIVIHDDASTDGTQEIIRQYASRHPCLFFPLLQSENQFSLGRKPTLINAPRWRGKYVALCEGDDYWTDPLKLQKQVDFLENHPDYNICFHRSEVVENGKVIPDELEARFNRIISEKIDALDLIREGNFINTASTMFRNKASFPFEYKYTPAGDYLLHILNSQSGYIKRLDDKMSVYRRGVGIYSTLDNINMTQKRLMSQACILSYLHDDKCKKMMLETFLKTLDDFSAQHKARLHNTRFLSRNLSPKELMKILLNKLNVYRKTYD